MSDDAAMLMQDSRNMHYLFLKNGLHYFIYSAIQPFIKEAEKMKMNLALCTFLSCTVIGTGYYASQTPAQRASLQQQPVAAQRNRDSRQWRPAVYRGLTLGTSTSADVLRILGDPQWAGPPTDQMADEPNPVIWYEYENGGDFPGRLTAAIDERSGKVKWISISTDSLERKEVLKHFGPGYIVTKYDFDLCLGDEESSPLYESPNGHMVNLEYRERGVAIQINELGKVTGIDYVSEPFGATESKCKQSSTGESRNSWR
jgi:hypothetical protein